MVAHVAREVDLVGGGEIAGGANIEQRRAGAVIRRDEHARAANDRRRDVGGAVVRLAVGPQQPAIARIDGQRTLPVKKTTCLRLPVRISIGDE